ncbi:E3 ubiquitin-protein ligase HRD1 [Termitomyces sp. J132]|nr:hypothetical protein H2248_005067 [Termitomyces sp. 'cryptogamus']KNZ78804.1 E3 ubiquitin-protein ligase HRD1 [Termitomyces sp. J132]
MPFHGALRHGAHALVGSLNSHRILLYAGVSMLAVTLTIINALRNYSNFYSVAISLSKSNRSVLALANFGFLVSLLCGHLVQRIFFGTLRANEVERLYDRLWFFITESLLAFTIFRDEFDIPFAMMFGFLLFVKSFHWLASDRIEWMDQRPYPGPSPLFHVRMTSLFIILWLTDLLMFLVSVENTIANGVGGMVLFASEYGILMASVLNTISKYLLSAYELRRAGRRGGENAPPWENKSMWTFYIELATDFLKLTTYLVFFMIIITFYGLPLNIVRDVYITARSFITRLRALHRYQTATRNMDQRYPNATAEELMSMSDHTCIICREEMVFHEATRQQGQGQVPATPDGPNTTPKKLPCGHIFHFHCLRSWLERQQSCPTCRRTVLDVQPQGQDPAAPLAEGAQGEPRRPNNLVPEPIQNQNLVNNPLGNPLGLVGRLFGPPVQPPLAPGQHLPGQAPHNQNNPPQNLGNLANPHYPQGVVIQYHVQYQLPRTQQQNNSQQALQATPQFPGFQGPGGAWQPWPHDVAAPDATITAADTQMQQTTTAIPAPPSSIRDNEEAASATPREAAALAALRRLNDSSSNRTSSSSSSQSSVSQGSLIEAQYTEGSSSSSARSNQHSPPVPSLIPLYDYTEINSGLASVPTMAGSSSRYSTPELHSRISPGQVGNSRPSARNVSRLQNGQRNILPPTLTDEQLAVMDRLTREAIDERLRVLEGVSSAVYRCIDDLMRMRSALPSPNAAAPAQPTPTLSRVSTSGDASTSSISAEVPRREASPVSYTSASSDWANPQPGGSSSGSGEIEAVE